METEYKLKPCPFCGGRAEFTLTGMDYFRIQCSNCSCGTSSFYFYNFYKKQLEDDTQSINPAIDAWNNEIIFKPCPFCGSNDISFWGRGVKCYSCGAEISWRRNDEDECPREKSYIKWNARFTNDN